RLALVLLLAPLGLEGALRAALALRGHPYTAAGARAEIQGFLDAQLGFVPGVVQTRQEREVRENLAALRAHGRVIEDEEQHMGKVPRLHPYLGYLTQQSFEAHELWLEAYPRLRSEGRAVVAILGGSVAAIFSSTGAPRWLEELREDPRIAALHPVVLSFAEGGHKQPQAVHALSLALSLGIVPDVVLLIDGYNETAVAYDSAERGAHPAFPSFTHYAHVAATAGGSPELIDALTDVRIAQRALVRTSERALASGSYRLALLGYPTLRRIVALRGAVIRGYGRYSQLLEDSQTSNRFAKGPQHPRWKAEPIAACVEVWQDSSRQLAALCERYGIAYVHVLQPTLMDVGAKPKSPEERAIAGPPDWDLGAERGYPLLRAAGAELAAEGILFLDASRVFEAVEETLYYDCCHFGDAGNARLAEWIAERTREPIARHLEGRPPAGYAPPAHASPAGG
ncbi:MAG TPA: hypothetical protein VJP77_08165, partial [Planctomycetota bacterium]|nr:hypothetical protein [Planctomycetota bacterium]